MNSIIKATSFRTSLYILIVHKKKQNESPSAQELGPDDEPGQERVDFCQSVTTSDLSQVKRCLMSNH